MNYRIEIYFEPLNHQIATMYATWANEALDILDNAKFQDEFRIEQIEAHCYKREGENWRKLCIAELCEIRNEIEQPFYPDILGAD